MIIELTPRNAEIVRHLSLITGERYDDIVNELIDNLPNVQTKTLKQFEKDKAESEK